MGKENFPMVRDYPFGGSGCELDGAIARMETIGLLRQSDHGHAVETVAGMLTITNAEAHEGAGYTLVPFFRTLSTDLNFTLALALISVFMTQVIGVQAQGIRYFSKFLNFTTMFSKPAFGFMDFIVGILELISELAKILSFTFRLFGVMFSGFVLVALVGSMVPIFAPAMIYMFEALWQSFRLSFSVC